MSNLAPSRKAVIATVAAVAVAAAVSVVALSRAEPAPGREISASVAGREAVRRILVLPVPLHQVAHDALQAIDEAEHAVSGPNDGAGLTGARAHVAQARVAIMGLESDPGISREQRAAASDLSRQLQRLLISVDAALGD